MQELEERIHLIFTRIHSSFYIPSHENLLKKISEEFGNEIFDNLLKSIKVCEEFQVGTAKETTLVIDHEIESFKKKVIQYTGEMEAKFSALEK